jgi:nucleoside-diphosphate-sugar epimerase
LYLITGVAGFIGSSLAHALVARGERVRGVDNFATGKRQNVAELDGRIEFIEGSVEDSALMRNACEGVEYIFHEAALASVPRSVSDPLATNRANIDGTLNLLWSAKNAGVKRVVYAASSSAYGDTPTLPKHEGMIPNPISPYAVSKLAAEHYMTSFYRVYGLETVSLRYFNIFGPRQDANSQYSAVLAKFITVMLEGAQPVIYGDGEQSRDFTYIDNAVQANLLACTAPKERACGKAFNVATGRRFSLNQTFEILKTHTGYAGTAKYDTERAGDVKHSLADVGAAKEALGYEPLVHFEEGLRRTVEWYRANLETSMPTPQATTRDRR